MAQCVCSTSWPVAIGQTALVILVWAHSHAGNTLALASNLLASPEGGAAFFRACRAYYRRPGGVREGLEHWPRVERQLQARKGPLRRIVLDVVTFGTPIRYGWDTAGYGKLLHVVHHCPGEGLPAWQAALPKNRQEAAKLRGDGAYGEGVYGDLVQQIGIAGTNFTPPLSARHIWRAERRLRRLVEAGVRRRDLLTRLRCGQRVAADGTTLLVDYGPGSGALAGHAVYTRERWLAFHVGLIDYWLYGQSFR